MTIPKDLAKKRDEYLQEEIISSAKCCNDCESLCKRVSTENGYAVRAFNAGVLAAFESEHVKALVEALKNILDEQRSRDNWGLQDYETAMRHDCHEADHALAKWSKRNE